MATRGPGRLSWTIGEIPSIRRAYSYTIGPRRMSIWIADRRPIIERGERRPKVMGIVNTTPDSFSDGGLAFDREDAVRHGLELVRQGAEILDVGGESSRPGAEVVSVEEELRRVIPVVEALAARAGVPISVDTVKPEVAKAALAAGASIVNDIEGLSNPKLAEVVSQSQAGVVLMHMRGTPRDMQDNPRYDDVVGEVLDFLARRVDEAERMGIARERIAIDPGIGFGKTQEHNLTLLGNLRRFGDLGCSVLVGVSRKGFLGIITGRDRSRRATASAVCSLAAAVEGASVLRVHDVDAMVDTIKVWEAVRGWNEERDR